MDRSVKKLIRDQGQLVVGPQIGKGAFGAVYRCTSLRNHMNYACKIINLQNIRSMSCSRNFQLDRLLTEVRVMRQLKHPNIVRLFNTIQSEDTLVLQMELVLGIDLFDNIMELNDGQGMDEDQAKTIFYQVCSAVEYMHSQGVVHRDIKPENVLLQGGVAAAGVDPPQTIPIVKLVDFGLSRSETKSLRSVVGTSRYVAPEIVALGRSGQSTSYDSCVDCYSLGVLLHVMLGGCFPQFNDKGDKMDLTAKVWFKDSRIVKASAEAHALISALMDPVATERMSARAALEHSWLEGVGCKVESFLGRVDSESLVDQPDARDSTKFLKAHQVEVDIEDTVLGSGCVFQTIGLVLNMEDAKVTKPKRVRTFSEKSEEDNRKITDHHHSFNDFTQALHKARPSGVSPDHLVLLQAQIAACMEEAYHASSGKPGLESLVRKSALQTRDMMNSSLQLTKKLQQTALSVLEMMPDLKVAMEEGEFKMAVVFFETIKEWVVELKAESITLIQTNSGVIQNLSCVIEETKTKRREHLVSMNAEDRQEEQTKLSVEFSSMDLDSESDPPEADIERMFDVLIPELDVLEKGASNCIIACNCVDVCSGTGNPKPHPHHEPKSVNSQKPLEARSQIRHMSHALSMLKAIDTLLQEHSHFWTNMELVVDVLKQRINHIEGMVSFTRNPRLRGRFVRRVEDYFKLWDRVQLMCTRLQTNQSNFSSKAYKFLA